jgi:hypothetical protein
MTCSMSSPFTIGCVILRHDEILGFCTGSAANQSDEFGVPFLWGKIRT